MQKKLADPDPMRNTVISKNISIGFDALSNMNLLIIGGSGSGKTSGIVIPNILLANCTSRIAVSKILKKKEFRWIRLDGGQYRISRKSFDEWLDGEIEEDTSEESDDGTNPGMAALLTTLMKNVAD